MWTLRSLYLDLPLAQPFLNFRTFCLPHCVQITLEVLKNCHANDTLKLGHISIDLRSFCVILRIKINAPDH